MMLPQQQKAGISLPIAVGFVIGFCVGAGCLAFPKVIDSTGWMGVLLLTFCMMITTYTTILLSKAFSIAATMYSDCQSHVAYPYPLLAEKTCGKLTRYWVTFCSFTVIYGTAVAYLLLVSENLNKFLFSVGSSIPFCGCILITTAVVVPLCWFRTPKDFWVLGIVSPVSMSVALVLVIIDIILYDQSQEQVQHADFDFMKFATGFGVIIFTICLQTSILTIQMDMARQSDMTWAIFISIMIILLHYYPIVATGYLVYGQTTDANLFNSAPAGLCLIIALVFFTMHFLLGIIMYLNPIFQEVEYVLNVSQEFTWKRCITRTLIVGLVLLAAMLVPRFDAVMSLLGGCTASLLSYVFPVLCYNKICAFQKVYILTKYGDIAKIQKMVEANEMTTARKIFHIGIILFGIAGGFIATVAAIVNILTPGKRGLTCFMQTFET